jgi:hypothetical protein
VVFGTNNNAAGGPVQPVHHPGALAFQLPALHLAAQKGGHGSLRIKRALGVREYACRLIYNHAVVVLIQNRQVNVGDGIQLSLIIVDFDGVICFQLVAGLAYRTVYEHFFGVAQCAGVGTAEPRHANGDE